MTLQSSLYQKFITLLRNALKISDELPAEISADEWTEIYKFAQKQALLGVVFEGVRKLQGKSAPPFALLMQWTATAEKIRTMNKSFYAECQRLTKFFEDNGRKTAILKGQANSLLYPDQFIRQHGDIDIYVEGGKESVIELLKSMNL
ncbi:MAG: nucleotidyltransferase family protein, partial [Bacteroidales bacterium]|nr:nucleotidyltransferase family protein [Bacteroidales bacterium]